MIKCSCKSCGKRFNVPPTFAGKKGRCPECKAIVVILPAEQVQAAAKAPAMQDVGASSTLSFGTADIKLSFPDILETDRIAIESQQQQRHTPSAIDDARMFQKPIATNGAKSDGKRKFPWPIDIFLYPTNGAGLTQLAIFLGIPFLIGILTMVAGPFGMFIGIPGIVVMIVINAYMAWYVCECIRDSGNGGVRAPDVLVGSPDLWEVGSQLFQIFACYVFFLAPMIFYFGFTKRFDTVFWALGSYAIFFFPMGLLAVTMFGSLSGLNPILLIGSIVRVFFSYCIMIAGLTAVTCLFVFLHLRMPRAGAGQFIIRCADTYLVLVTAHLLGRFYYWKADKLNWDV
ncbi:MAG: hypothetical protein Q7T18_12800 [Sedimentisphaerales bacterium]|nr:hypothetical protein [Sedimentisphaerales bacterium]